MKKKLISIFQILIALLLISCETHTIVDFENEDLPSRALPIEISDKVLKKYKIGSTIVLPSLQHSNIRQSSYVIKFDFFSKKETKMGIREVIVLVDGKKSDFDKTEKNDITSILEYKKEIDYFYRGVSKGTIHLSTPEKINHIEILYKITEFDKNNKVAKGKGQILFTPKKRTYWE